MSFNRKLYDQRKAESKCTGCGAVDDRTLNGCAKCEVCEARNLFSNQMRRRKRLKNHMCIYCGKPMEEDPSLSEYYICEECRAKQVVYNRKHREKIREIRGIQKASDEGKA